VSSCPVGVGSLAITRRQQAVHRRSSKQAAEAVASAHTAGEVGQKCSPTSGAHRRASAGRVSRLWSHRPAAKIYAGGKEFGLAVGIGRAGELMREFFNRQGPAPSAGMSAVAIRRVDDLCAATGCPEWSDGSWTDPGWPGRVTSLRAVCPTALQPSTTEDDVGTMRL